MEEIEADGFILGGPNELFPMKDGGKSGTRLIRVADNIPTCRVRYRGTPATELIFKARLLRSRK